MQVDHASVSVHEVLRRPAQRRRASFRLGQQRERHQGVGGEQVERRRAGTPWAMTAARAWAAAAASASGSEVVGDVAAR